jgi:hypothetical protein
MPLVKRGIRDHHALHEGGGARDVGNGPSRCSHRNPVAVRYLLLRQFRRMADDTDILAVPPGGCFSSLSPCSSAAEWWLAVPPCLLVAMVAATSSACRSPGSVSARVSTPLVA